MEQIVSPSGYRDYDEQAGLVLHDAMRKAVGIVRGQQKSAKAPNAGEKRADSVQWPACNSFTVKQGMEAIEEYLKTWSYHSSWQYCIDFVRRAEHTYRYRVRWSQPTRRVPIPKATASVFFALEAHSNAGSKPVSVSFIFEGQKLVHYPETTIFREKWLRDIVECKLLLQEQVDF